MSQPERGLSDSSDASYAESLGPSWWQEPLLPTEVAPRAKLELLAKQKLMKTSTSVVLGGGAMYGLSYIGSFMELCSSDPSVFREWSKNIRNVAGTSAGALVGFMLAAGWDPWRMERLVKTCGLPRVVDGVLNFTARRLKTLHALSSGEALEAVLKEVVAVVTGSSDTTLGEFHRATQRTFFVVVTNRDKNTPEYWSYRTRPLMPVWLALRCTASVPFLFPSPVIDGFAYMDGGVTCNIPCHIFPPASTLTMFVHGRSKTVTSLKSEMGNVLAMYTSSAQLGPMRVALLYAIRAFPCMPDIKHPLGAFAFDSSEDMMDEIVAAGALAARAVLLRPLLVLAMIGACRRWSRLTPSTVRGYHRLV